MLALPHAKGYALLPVLICGVPVAVPGFVGLTKTAKFAAAVVFKIFKTVGKSPELGTLDMP
jgi:hypothetical protein